MYTSVIILVIIYTLFLLYVYIKYNLDAKNKSENIEIYRDKLDISPSEAAYLINKNCNSLNIILADILNLINKGYIKLTTKGEGEERDYIFTKSDNITNMNIKSHEMASFRLFFKNDSSVSLKKYIRELEFDKQKLKELELKTASIKTDIEFELEKQGIIDKISERKFFKLNRLSISMILIFGFIFVFALLLQLNAEIIEFTFIGTLLSILFYNSTDVKEDKLTEYGAETKNKAEGYKKFVSEYMMAENKPLYMVNVLEYNYTMAVAFGIAKLGESEFLNNTYKKIQIKKVVRNIICSVIIIIIIILMFM